MCTNIDQMAHHMIGNGNGCQDFQKILPTLLTWEKVQEEVNELIRFKILDVVWEAHWDLNVEYWVVFFEESYNTIQNIGVHAW